MERVRPVKENPRFGDLAVASAVERMSSDRFLTTKGRKGQPRSRPGDPEVDI